MPYIIRRFNLDALPFTPTRKEPTLPHFPVVYIIFDEEGRVFYVGATKSLYSRWSAHRTNPKLRSVLKRKNVKVAWIRATIEQLSDFEYALIQFLNPKLNLIRNGKSYHHANKRPNRAAFHRLEATNGNGK